MTAYIIAAGDGSRLYEEGLSIKKPLIPINGTPMIERLIDTLDSLGFTEFNIITKETNIDVIELLVSIKYLKNYNINVLEKTTPSSMHSLYELINKSNNYPFYLFTVDTIFSNVEFNGFINYCNSNQDNYEAVMAVTSYIDDEKPLYVSTNNGRINGFHDDYSEEFELITSGMYYFNCDIFSLISNEINKGSHKLRNFLRSLITNNFKVGYYKFSKTIDVDHITDIHKAEELINNIY